MTQFLRDKSAVVDLPIQFKNKQGEDCLVHIIQLGYRFGENNQIDSLLRSNIQFLDAEAINRSYETECRAWYLVGGLANKVIISAESAQELRTELTLGYINGDLNFKFYVGLYLLSEMEVRVYLNGLLSYIYPKSDVVYETLDKLTYDEMLDFYSNANSVLTYYLDEDIKNKSLSVKCYTEKQDFIISTATDMDGLRLLDIQKVNLYTGRYPLSVATIVNAYRRLSPPEDKVTLLRDKLSLACFLFAGDLSYLSVYQYLSADLLNFVYLYHRYLFETRHAGNLDLPMLSELLTREQLDLANMYINSGILG